MQVQKVGYLELKFRKSKQTKKPNRTLFTSNKA